jgi:6-phosphogluconolactonase
MNDEKTICTGNDPKDLAKMAAGLFLAEAEASIRQRDQFTVALSGGSTPRGMHRLLATEPWLTRVPWNKTHLFWVDERCVSPENPASNYGTAKRDFLDALPVSPDQIHFMTCGSSPPGDASSYQEMLMDFFAVPKGAVPQFDLIFLGMGADGHTASLFPGQAALSEKEKWVTAVRGGNPEVDRISMTLPLINRARHIAFLVSGLEKSEVLRSVLMDREIRYPAQQVKPLTGKLTWLLDRAAASLLPQG